MREKPRAANRLAGENQKAVFGYGYYKGNNRAKQRGYYYALGYSHNTSEHPIKRAYNTERKQPVYKFGESLMRS